MHSCSSFLPIVRILMTYNACYITTEWQLSYAHRPKKVLCLLFHFYEFFMSCETIIKLTIFRVKFRRSGGRIEGPNAWSGKGSAPHSPPYCLFSWQDSSVMKSIFLIHVCSVTFGFMSRKCSKVKLTAKCLFVPDPNFLSLMHIHALYKHFYIGAKALPSSCVRNTRLHRGSV
jgi:hypothetical protein